MSLAGLSEPTAPLFPPLLRGEPVAAGGDPFARAVEIARAGTDPGLIVYATAADRLEAAVVLAPEEPLSDAISAVFAVTIGLGDALGALAPPEVAVHYVWPGGLRVNGATCGRIRAMASTAEDNAEPDWLVCGIEIAFASEDDRPGATPDRTSLMEEGCGEITPMRLLESWSRHMLTWLSRREDEGIAPLHAEWRSRAWGMGKALEVQLEGDEEVFLGLDEKGGMLLKTETGTRLRPLTEMLE